MEKVFCHLKSVHISLQLYKWGNRGQGKLCDLFGCHLTNAGVREVTVWPCFPPPFVDLFALPGHYQSWIQIPPELTPACLKQSPRSFAREDLHVHSGWDVVQWQAWAHGEGQGWGHRRES